MPERFDWNDPALWGPIVPTSADSAAALYQTRIGDPNSPNFGLRVGMGHPEFDVGHIALAQEKVQRLIDNPAFPLYSGGVPFATHPFPVQTTDRILIAGCGIPYLIDEFKKAGYSETFGIDKSTEIASRNASIFDEQSGVILVSEDMTGGQAKTALRDATGDDEFHWIVSESAVEGYDMDNSLTALLNAANGGLFRALTPPQGTETWRIIHLVNTSPWLDPQNTVADLPTWAAFRADQSWVSYESGPQDKPGSRSYPNWETVVGVST
jgi:hypothetical protein